LVLEIGKAIINELELQRDYLGTEHIETIYLGGGTPSILDSSTIEKLLKSVYKNFTVVPGSEVTLEANPEDITFEKLRELKSIGINRLSVGVQTFNDAVLKFLNRSHNGKQAKQSIEIARKAGYTNLNLDLIYAIPGRDYKNLEQDLIQIIDLIPEHISAYSLTIEKNTVFGKWADIRKLKIVSDEENASQFEIVFDKLHEAGYDHYEISNYAKPGFASIHNTNYWRQKKYLGVGPSAHSYNGFNRQANVSNNNSYLRSIQLGSIPATVEELKREDLINEYIMTSLRTKWGCNLNYLKVEYQFDLMGSQPNSIQWAIENGLMELNELTLKLTQSGKMHSDKLSSDLFLIN
jgi:oxygen-independent coproporphyrinogen-3 oxidase